MGFILQSKKFYKNRLLERLFLNKKSFWYHKTVGDLSFYKTTSVFSFNFALNLLAELNRLTLVEPPAYGGLITSKTPTIPLTPRLLWEEIQPVQKKYGPRYRRSNRHKKFSFKLIPVSVPTTRERYFLKTGQKKRGDLQLRYFVWKKNLMTKAFFLNQFWKKGPLSPALLSCYNLLLFSCFSRLVTINDWIRVLLFVHQARKFFIFNCNAYHSPVVR